MVVHLAFKNGQFPLTTPVKKNCDIEIARLLLDEKMRLYGYHLSVISKYKVIQYVYL